MPETLCHQTNAELNKYQIILRVNKRKKIHHRVTENTEDNETKKILEILCALCVSVVKFFILGF